MKTRLCALVALAFVAVASGRSAHGRELESESEAEEKEEDTMFKWTCVVGILSLGATFTVGHWLESKHFTRLPEAGVGVLMGALAAGGAYYLNNQVMLDKERFDFEFFMVWLLPPIIFEAGFNMNVHAFIDNLGPTMFFAFVGTFGSTFVVGGLVWYAGQLGWCYPLGLLSALTFGSLISATDPVTVLAVFQVRVGALCCELGMETRATPCASTQHRADIPPCLNSPSPLRMAFR
jgi:hypothetical protein